MTIGWDPQSNTDERGGEKLTQVIRHRTFLRRLFSHWFVGGAEKLRADVEEFINSRVGPENVVSITESGTRFGPSSITVWYRDKAD